MITAAGGFGAPWLTQDVLWQWTRDLDEKNTLHRWPVRRLLWPFILLVIAAGWLAVLRQVGNERREAERAAIDLAQNRAIALEQYVIRTLQAASLVSLHLGYKYFIHKDLPKEAADGVRPLRIIDPVVERDLFAGAQAANPEGDFVATTLGLTRRTSVASHPVFLKQRRTAGTELLISGPYRSPFVPGQFIHMSRRITRNGATLGYISLQMSPGKFINFPENSTFKTSDLVSVIGLNGISLARREGALVSSGEDLRGKLVMRMQQRSPNGTYLGPSSLDGHVRYFSHRRLAKFPIFVTAGVSRSDALAPVNRRAIGYYTIMALITAACLAIAWLIGMAIAAREKRSAALAEASRRLAEAQRVAGIGDWEYDVSTGHMIWSDPLCEMYERPCDRDRLTLQEFRSYLRPQDVRRVDSAIAAAVATGDIQNYDFQVQLPSGSLSHRHVIAVPVKDSQGKVVRVYGTDQDVTQRNLIQSLQAQVAHLDRQGAMSMMAATLAHELNQPLAAASNYLTGVRNLAENGGPEAQQHVKDGVVWAQEQVHGAADIIRRVREMVRNQTDGSKVASLPEVTENSIALLVASGAIREHSISVTLQPNLSQVRIDPIQLQQVLINLLRNALEAAPKDGPDVRLNAFNGASRMVQIEVSDNGSGFDRSPDQIFSPFRSEKEGGTGLGLSICRTIVEYHGGKLFVSETRPGRTVVVVELQVSP